MMLTQIDSSPLLLEESQVEPAAALLARAFQDDPMMRYLTGGEVNMLEKPLAFYRAAIHMGLLYGEVHITPALDAVAVWIRPGSTDFSLGQMLRSGMLTATLSLGLGAMGRMMRSANHVLSLEKQIIQGPRWVLMFVGVEPTQRGKGIGAQLLQPILERAAADSLPCYLESTNERNLSFYDRLGFHVAAESEIPKGGPRFWVMLKSPDQD